MSAWRTVSASQLAALDSRGNPEVIDVRTPVEYREVHSRNVPLDSLHPLSLQESRNGRKDDPLYFICKSVGRGAQACQKFIDDGYDNVVNVEGGTDAWVEARLPVVRGKKVMSLERQVRIVAGFLVLVGALLGIFLHPWFASIAVFVGAGLMFAGITDSCAMGLLIAKMPWNQVEGTGQ